MSATREDWRRAAVRSCEIFFILILLEGILRKWLMNPIQQPLTLIRDPVLAIIYFQYFNYKGGRVSLWVVAVLAMFVIFLGVIFVQSEYLPYHLDVYAIGIRNYLFYVPLSFIMGEIYSRYEVNRLLRVFLYSTIPAASLVIVQFYSPVGSIWNKAIDNSIDAVFVVVDGVVRPYGPFTFVLGQATYAAMALAIGLIAFERKKAMLISTLTMIFSLVAIGSMGVVSGSRSYFISAGAIFIFYILSALTYLRRSLFRRAAYAVVAILSLFILMTVVFPRALETMTERQADSVATEGPTLGRALFMATEVFSIPMDTPLFGLGIGYGSNAGTYAATGQVTFTLAEYEWTRIALECGPLLGGVVIIIRIVMTIWVIFSTFRINIRLGDSAPLIFCGFVAPLIFYAPISNNNSMISIAWFSLGLLYALIRTARETAGDSATARVTMVNHLIIHPEVIV